MRGMNHMKQKRLWVLVAVLGISCLLAPFLFRGSQPGGHSTATPSSHTASSPSVIPPSAVASPQPGTPSQPAVAGHTGTAAASAPGAPAAEAQPSSASPGAQFASNGPSGSPSPDDAVRPGTASSRDALAGAAASPGGTSPAPSSRATGSVASHRSIPDILAGANLEIPEVRARVVAEMTAAEDARYQAVLEKAAELDIPVRVEGPGHRVAILHDFRGDEPVYRTTLNANAAISSNASQIREAPYALNGSGIKVGVWDGGYVRYSHQEFGGRVTVKGGEVGNYVDHATHVAGTIGASGVQPAAKGMAPSVAIDSYDWNNDYAEMTAAGTVSSSDTSGVPISNHSYGLDSYYLKVADMGMYEQLACDLDFVAASLPYYLPFWAAGNDQTWYEDNQKTSYGGFHTMNSTSLAKNVLTVGATEDAVTNGVRNVSLALITDFSSMGPCDDGRIKPDVVANGMDLYSPIGTGDSDYDTYMGTSMATPSAAGSAALLAQLYAEEFNSQRMRASMLKALLIHTADDLGNAGPDYTCGWGLINVLAAANVILDHKGSFTSPKMIEGSVTASITNRTYTMTWDGTSPIRATLCWTDPAGAVQSTLDSRKRNLKHDLDLRITAPDGQVYTPFIMPFVGTWTKESMSLPATTGDNNVDNVEQVYLPTPSLPGTYTVAVTLDSSLETNDQVYSLVLTGGTEINPPPAVSLLTPASGTIVNAGTPVTLSAAASDFSLGGVTGAVASVEFFVNGESLENVTGTPYEATWTPGAYGIYELFARATDTEGAWSVSATNTVVVLSDDGKPVITSFTPTAGVSGTSVSVTGLNFANVTNVTFNGLSSTSFMVHSLTNLTATVPASATTGPIGVATLVGSVESASDFTIIETPIAISQIYGGGGEAGSIYNRDYVELYNRSSVSVPLAGWSLQSTSATGTVWATTLLSGSIEPGAYYLVELAGGRTGAALPTADITGTANLDKVSGKVALRSTPDAFTISWPTYGDGLQDLVGYGTANAYEGSGAALSPSVTRAIFRLGAGATDSDNNSADFALAAPSPRNSLLPTISSPLTATGTKGELFSYQITARNPPISGFDATGLPASLKVNRTTGLISGLIESTGVYPVTLSATNTVGVGVATLTLTVSKITVGGMLAEVSTQYGTASAPPAQFTVAGENLTEGVLVTPPAGFEVSQTSGGATGYASTQTVGTAGSFLAKTVYLRIKADTDVGTYSGNVACSSSMAQTVYIPTTPSDVTPAPLGITADDQTKTFGTILTLGTGQTTFTSSGLVLGQTVGSVTLTASGGLGKYNVPGTYDLTPSDATGGTFNPANYDITYTNGTLTVESMTYAGWIAQWPGLIPLVSPTDDYEPDGLPNLVEYFMGLDPMVADAGVIMPVVPSTPGEFRVRYPRSKNQYGTTGVTGGIVWKLDLLDPADWSDVGVVETKVDDGDGLTYEIWEATITTDPPESVIFVRLRVIQD